jgi:hypothetical protein
MVSDESDAGRLSDVEKAQMQSIYREVNERVMEVSAHRVISAAAQDAICECAKPECSEPIAISAGEYERLREHGTWFAVAPGDDHVFPEIERIVEKNEGFWIVEKLEQAGAVAEKLDPRDRRTPLQT